MKPAIQAVPTGTEGGRARSTKRPSRPATLDAKGIDAGAFDPKPAVGMAEAAGRRKAVRWAIEGFAAAVDDPAAPQERSLHVGHERFVGRAGVR